MTSYVEIDTIFGQEFPRRCDYQTNALGGEFCVVLGRPDNCQIRPCPFVGQAFEVAPRGVTLRNDLHLG